MNLPWNGSKLPWYDSKLMCDFNPRKSRVKVTAVIYRSIFITQAPEVFVLVRPSQASLKFKDKGKSHGEPFYQDVSQSGFQHTG